MESIKKQTDLISILRQAGASKSSSFSLDHPGATVYYRPSGRGKAQCSSDPRYPNGIAVNVSKPFENACTFKLPYPAPECGMHILECQLCKQSVAITAAGRVDDPSSVTIGCLTNEV